MQSPPLPSRCSWFRRGLCTRALAGLIALAAWAGIAIHFHALASGPASWAAALWTLIGYFTMTTNLLVAIVFTGFALRSTDFDSPSLLAETLLSILLVGIVYAVLLRGLRELTTGSEVANLLLHQATPLMVAVFWLAFVRKGALRWLDPFIAGAALVWLDRRLAPRSRVG